MLVVAKDIEAGDVLRYRGKECLGVVIRKAVVENVAYEKDDVRLLRLNRLYQSLLSGTIAAGMQIRNHDEAEAVRRNLLAWN